MSDRLLPGFIARVATSSKFDHWQGGPATHKGAYCATCNRPWLLIWDINCADPRFVREGEPVFGDSGRLPLYYCWKCCGDASYRVTEPDRIHVFESNGKYQGDDFPYENYPIAFDRCPIELSRPSEMPAEIEKFISEGPEESSPAPPSAEFKNQLEYWLDHSISHLEYDIWWQQFGGDPWRAQGSEEFLCPNPECETGRARMPIKVLASIVNHPLSGLPMIETIEQVKQASGVVNRWVQIVVHLCPECHTIHVCNRCG
jgi:hypothetical protein